MREYDIHLVGSIPLRNATEVFETVAARLGPRLLRLPDGETGARSHWLGWLEPVFSGHPAFEPTGRSSRPHAAGDARPQHRLKRDVAPGGLRFSRLPIADVAIASFAEFKRLKSLGAIPARVRFQVSIANPLSVVERFVTEEHHDVAYAAYERALLEEIDRMTHAIPHDQLAIQWDVASRVMTALEIGKPTRLGKTRDAMMRELSTRVIHWGNAVPPDVDLLFHLCYGDNAHRHVVEPSSLDVSVQFATALAAGSGRSIQLIHMPVPRDRHDAPYFEPLRRLALRPETRLCLGLVHYTDGVEGTRRRLATAERYVEDFLIATECGFGRRAPETISGLLDIHAEIAGLTAPAD
jgi:hypothetical protein